MRMGMIIAMPTPIPMAMVFLQIISLFNGGKAPALQSGAELPANLLTNRSPGAATLAGADLGFHVRPPSPWKAGADFGSRSRVIRLGWSRRGSEAPKKLIRRGSDDAPKKGAEASDAAGSADTPGAAGSAAPDEPQGPPGHEVPAGRTIPASMRQPGEPCPQCEGAYGWVLIGN